MKYNDRLFNKTQLKKFRKRLRNNLTAAEAFLWKHLKNKQLHGRRFRRQFGVGNYILDFYCPAEKLVVELDGDSHYSEKGIARDLKRDKFLNSLGIKVIRFENCEVFDNIEGVLEIIKNKFSRDS